VALDRRLAAALVRPLGGALVGLSVAAMHYLGMAALEVAGSLAWDPRLVLASLLLGSGFGAVALLVGLAGRSRSHVAAGALLLTLAICSLHFTGMAAVTIEPDPRVAAPAAVLGPGWLALAVAFAGSAVLLLSLVGLALNRREQRRVEAHDALVRELADFAVEGLAVCDGPEIVAANESLAGMTGRSKADLASAKLPDLLADLRVSRCRLARATTAWQGWAHVQRSGHARTERVTPRRQRWGQTLAGQP
jgi:hypothetical protein